MNVLQMPGEVPGFAPAHVRQRRIQGNVSGVGLGTGCHEYRRIAQRNPGFRHSQLQRHIHSRIHNRNDLGKCQPHVLCRNDHQSAAGGLHLSGFQQPGKIVAGGIRVGTPDGLLQGGQQVIVAVAIPVCPQGAFLGDGFRVGKCQG